ncbi:hypothetical protein D3C76_1200370 [compost metagenome]
MRLERGSTAAQISQNTQGFVDQFPFQHATIDTLRTQVDVALTLDPACHARGDTYRLRLLHHQSVSHTLPGPLRVAGSDHHQLLILGKTARAPSRVSATLECSGYPRAQQIACLPAYRVRCTLQFEVLLLRRSHAGNPRFDR